MLFLGIFPRETLTYVRGKRNMKVRIVGIPGEKGRE